MNYLLNRYTTMETVRNAVSSAFGSSNNSAQNETNGTEPVSGQTGAGTANEPFDKGNENENGEYLS